MTLTETNPDAIAKAAKIIQDGGLVAFPTETVYGLGADATNARAVARIYTVKGRPKFNPLIVHVPTIAAAEIIAELSADAKTLAARFWPGALTLVARRQKTSPTCDLVSAGLGTIALRIPNAAVAIALLKATDRPIAAPSANRSGRVSPTRADHVTQDLGDTVDQILDGGICKLGIESTVLDVTTDQITILRPGAIDLAVIENTLGRRIPPAGDTATVRSPGQLASHYAPHAPIRLNAIAPEPGEAFLAFGVDHQNSAEFEDGFVNISVTGNLEEAAANLYAALRDLDRLNPQKIAVMPIPNHGLGEAINDRLRRAAAPRSK